MAIYRRLYVNTKQPAHNLTSNVRQNYVGSLSTAGHEFAMKKLKFTEVLANAS